MRVKAETLGVLERLYSGGFEFVTPPEPSEIDPVTAPKSVFDGHRFQPRGTCKNRAHDYGARYETALQRFDSEDKITIVELGVLRGVGLAVWCELFPNATVIGLDIDLKHFHKNRETLVARGAFQKNQPRVYRFDELSPTSLGALRDILRGETVDVFIDDALHYTSAIVQSFFKLLPAMARDAVYIIEDNSQCAEAINRQAGKRVAVQYNEMAVIDLALLNEG